MRVYKVIYGNHEWSRTVEAKNPTKAIDKALALVRQDEIQEHWKRGTNITKITAVQLVAETDE